MNKEKLEKVADKILPMTKLESYRGWQMRTAKQILSLFDGWVELDELDALRIRISDLEKKLDDREADLIEAKREEREWFDSWHYNSDTEENPDGVEERYYYYTIPEIEYERHIKALKGTK